MEQREPAPIETFRGVAYPWFCDSMGHMNTQHYCSMFDVATFHLLACFGGFRAFKEKNWGWADRKQTITYDKEVASGDLLIVRSELLRAGRTSITFLHRMTDQESGEPRASSENVTVFFDLKARSAMPLTGEMLAIAEGLKAKP